MSQVFVTDHPQIFDVQKQPTFDLQSWRILDFQASDQLLFCVSEQVFQFDQCKGTILPRSRILRLEKTESQLVKNVIAAVIDAGFVGHLYFKIELTTLGCQELQKDTYSNFQSRIANSVQIDLMPYYCNYYNGTNQSKLKPDICFKAGRTWQTL